MLWLVKRQNADEATGSRPRSSSKAGEEATTVPSSDFSTHARLLKHHSLSDMTALTWSPCGRYLAAGSRRSGALVVWDMSYAEAIVNDSRGEDDRPTVMKKLAAKTVEMAFSPDGSFLLVSQVYD